MNQSINDFTTEEIKQFIKALVDELDQGDRRFLIQIYSIIACQRKRKAVET